MLLVGANRVTDVAAAGVTVATTCDNTEPHAAVTVRVPAKPGLGVEVDWERMDKLTVARM